MTPQPAIIPKYALGPSAGRLQPGEARPFYIVCDASTVDQFHRFFKDTVGDKDYKRLEALSPKGSRQVIFVITPVEMEILDWAKEKSKYHPDPTPLARALRGKGIVKSYDSMRTVSYLDQHIVVPLADTLGRYVGGDLLDFPAKVNSHPRKHTIGDEKRLDVRLGAMIGSMEAILEQQHDAEFLVFLRGDPIASRFEDSKTVTGSLAQRLSAMGDVLTAAAAQKFPTVLDGLLKAAAIGVSTQPQPHPSMTTQPSLQWADLLRSGKGWIIDPEMEALLPAPDIISPSDSTIRLIADSNVHAQLHSTLLELVSRLAGDIHMAALPEVTREAGAGRNRIKAERRLDNLKRLMNLKPSTWFAVMNRFMRGPRTWFYASSTDPVLVEPPTGDIRIRSEVALVVEELERNFPGRLLVVYITIDYNCELLVRAVPTKTGTLLVIRMDGREKDPTKVLDILCNVMKPWLA